MSLLTNGFGAWDISGEAEMQKLARIIATDLDKNGHSAVYLSEMARVWPDTKTREKKMTQFADSHHWRLRHYKHDFVAIFDKAPLPTTSDRRLARR